MSALASDWPRHFLLLFCNRWTEFNETWQEADLNILYQVCVFRNNGKTVWPHWPLIGWDIFDFSSETAEQTSTKLDRKQISTSPTKFMFFVSMGKTRWSPWPLIRCDILDFSSETAEANSTKPDRKQDDNVLYQVCVFSGRSKKQDGSPGFWLAQTFSTSLLKPLNGIRRNLMVSKISTFSTKFVFVPIGKNKMSALASDWLRHFRLLICNRWMEINETWQETRSQRPSINFFSFAGRSEIQDGSPGLWLAATFLTSPLKPLNGF